MVLNKYASKKVIFFLLNKYILNDLNQIYETSKYYFSYFHWCMY